jgi:cyclase
LLRPRVIPCLLVSQGGLVKTERFKNPQYVGDPNNAIRIFNDKEADELIVIDIDASLANRGPDLAMIEEFAGECFMPLTYGGGVRSLDDASRVFALGIEKICLQSAAIADPGLVSQIASRYGSQAVVAAVDVDHGRKGRERLRRIGRRMPHDWASWMCDMAEAGAGEVLLTSVTREGTLSGMDTDLIRRASQAVSVPVIANGGVACLEDIVAAFSAGASGVAAGAYFVFYGPHRAVLLSYLNDADFLTISGTP